MKKLFVFIIAFLIAAPTFAQKKEEIVQKISALESRMNSTIDDIRQKDDALNSKIRNLESLLSSQTEMSKASSARIDNLESQLKLLKDENAKLKTSLDSLRKIQVTTISTREPDKPKTELDSIYDVLDRYGSAVTIDERAQYVRHPETTKPLMVKYYGIQYKKKTFSKSSITLSKSHYNVGDIIYISYYHMYLIKTVQGYLVDWEASVGYNPTTLNHYESTHSLVTKKFKGELSDFENVNNTYYRVILSCGPSYDGYYCWIKKGTTVARDIEKLMSDGLKHYAIVEIKGDLDSDGEYTMDLVRFIKEGWME